MTLSRHDRRFAANAFVQLLLQFGEPLAYQSRPGQERDIVGIVDREPPVVYDGGGNPIYGDYVIRVHNSATRGILDTEVDYGNHCVSIRSRQSDGSCVVLKTIISKESEDSGVLVLRLR
jgi:hypothetical protein